MSDSSKPATDWKERALAAENAIMQDDLNLAQALHVNYCEDLIEDGTPWEVPAEPEPHYFATLQEAVVFLVNLPELESAPAQPDPGEEAPEAIALRYGFAVYDESAPNHLRVNKTAVEMLETHAASLRSEVAQLKNEVAKRGPHPHRMFCNYQSQPIGSPGCICVVTYKKHLSEAEAALRQEGTKG